jgi:hypothetical protein
MCKENLINCVQIVLELRCERHPHRGRSGTLDRKNLRLGRNGPALLFYFLGDLEFGEKLRMADGISSVSEDDFILRNNI